MILINKTGNNKITSNYRPVALTPNIAGIFGKKM